MDDFYKLFDYYSNFINNVCNKYNYSGLLKEIISYVVPAFIMRYGLRNEKLILEVFQNIPIIIDNGIDEYNPAQYSRNIVKKIDDFGITRKVVLKNYYNSDKFSLIDNIVHEFNHAVNSYRNEHYIDDNYLYLRSGLFYTKYDKKTLDNVSNDDMYILEEVINTKQSEEIVNIVANHLNSNYVFTSNAYYLQLFICKKLLENSTFVNTLYEYRLSGNISDIDYWFDNITGIDGSYKNLCNKLDISIRTELKYSTKKIFRGFYLNKIRDINKEIIKLIELFNNNCNYK